MKKINLKEVKARLEISCMSVRVSDEDSADAILEGYAALQVLLKEDVPDLFNEIERLKVIANRRLRLLRIVRNEMRYP